jgi:hypothetical protein
MPNLSASNNTSATIAASSAGTPAATRASLEKLKSVSKFRYFIFLLFDNKDKVYF